MTLNTLLFPSLLFYGVLLTFIIAYAAVTTSELEAIDFGSFLASGSAGNIQLGTTTIFTNVTGLGGDHRGRIQCNLTHPTSSATVTANASSTVITHTTSPSHTMTVEPITNSGNQITCTTSQTQIRWNSRLSIAANQEPGLYKGTFGATVSPNKGGSTADYLGNISAYVYTPLIVTQNSQINFGSFTPPTGATGSITINPTTGGVSTSNVNVISSAIRGVYSVTGEGNQSYSYSMSPQIVTLSSGISTMLLDIGTGGSSSLSAGGSSTFYLGGTLTVGINQSSGTYSGSFTITVDY